MIVTFYPNGCSQFENPDAPDFEKIAPLPTPFQHFRFRVRFQPLSSKCFRFYKKLTASTSLTTKPGYFHDKTKISIANT